MLTLAPDRPLVKPGDFLSFDDLRQGAKDAIGGLKQYEVADALGVTPPAVSLAVNKSGARYVELQRRIIERYTDVRIGESPVFKVERKGRG